jgi:hypothetical protein
MNQEHLNTSGSTPRQPTSDELESLVQEASDPLTSAGRLSAILDLADAPRIAYAEAYASARKKQRDCKESLEVGLKELAASTQQAAASGIDRLITAIASNPNLSRTDWLRAMEVAPSAAAKNPLAMLLLVERNPIVKEDFELLALGALAGHCISDPSDTVARDLLAELILAGLPVVEAFGSNFGEMDYGSLPCAAANRYRWPGDHLWCLRAVAIHRAGNAVTDALSMTPDPRTSKALSACLELSRDFTTGECERWRYFLNEVKIAPVGAARFTHTLLTRADPDDEYSAQDVVGWCDHGTPPTYYWLERRPGFWPGMIHIQEHDLPNELREIGKYYLTTDTAPFGVANDLSIFRVPAADGETDDEEVVQDGDSVTMISEGQFGEDGVVLLVDGCEFGRSFPADEIERLKRIFGNNSYSVQFAKNPAAARCPDCGHVALGLIAGDNCGHCDGSDED